MMTSRSASRQGIAVLAVTAMLKPVHAVTTTMMKSCSRAYRRRHDRRRGGRQRRPRQPTRECTAIAHDPILAQWGRHPRLDGPVRRRRDNKLHPDVKVVFERQQWTGIWRG